MELESAKKVPLNRITHSVRASQCKEILLSVLNYQGKVRRAKKDFAGALNAIGSLDT